MYTYGREKTEKKGRKSERERDEREREGKRVFVCVFKRERE